MAELAVAYQVQDRAALEALGIGGQEVVKALACGQSVAVVVESVEHAHGLQKLLPGWIVMTAVPVNIEVPGSTQTDEEVELELPDRSKVITTMLAAEKYKLVADIVIRADIFSEEWENSVSDMWPADATLVLVVLNRGGRLEPAESRTRLSR